MILLSTFLLGHKPGQTILDIRLLQELWTPLMKVRWACHLSSVKLAGPACQEHCQRCRPQLQWPGIRNHEHRGKSTPWVCRVYKGRSQLSDGVLELPLWHSILLLHLGALEFGLPACELSLSSIKSNGRPKHQDELWHWDSSFNFRASCETSRSGRFFLSRYQILT